MATRAERPSAARPRLRGFPPIEGVCARVLILGSMPSVASLAAQQYYAHPRNRFWDFMGELFGAGPEWPYPERAARLRAAGVAVWDVLQSCERDGSLDSAILRPSEEPNDILALFARQPRLSVVATNGGKALDAFRRHVLRRGPLPDGARLLALPSTSPANAGMSREAQLTRWRQLLYGT